MSRWGDGTDIQQLANRYNPDYEKPVLWDLRPPFERTGNLRQDVYNLIISKREDNYVAIAHALDISRFMVSQIVHEFVKDGVFTWDQLYGYLPKVKEASERQARRAAQRQQAQQQTH